MRFSIITPVYNAEHYLRQTIESVLAQTYPDWEMICTDDGSRDASGSILDQYAAKDDRIKVIHQANGGEGAARNAALKIAKGDWLVFLDADDILSPWALDEHVRLSVEFPEAEMTRLEMLQFADDATPKWARDLTRKSCNDELVDVRQIIPLRMSVTHFFQFAYRRSLFENLTYTDHYVGADRVMLTKCLARANYIACGEAASHGYRQIVTSIMGSKMSLRKIGDHIRYIRDCIDFSLSENGKRFDSNAMREFGNLLTERLVYDIHRLGVDDRSVAWHQFNAVLPWMRHLPNLSTWRRFTIMLSDAFRWLPFHCVPRLLCELSFRLKLKGIHR